MQFYCFIKFVRVKLCVDINITFLICNSVVKILCTVPTLTSWISAKARTVKRRSSSILFSTDVISDVVIFFCALSLSLLIMRSSPSLNRLCQAKTSARLAEWSPFAAFIFWYVTEGVSPSCWQNLIAARISSFSVDGILWRLTLSPVLFGTCLFPCLTFKWRQNLAWRQ